MMEATGLCLVWLVCAVIDLRTSRVVFILSCAIIQLSTLAFATCIYRLSPWHPLSKFDGPVLYRVSSLSFAKVIMSGWRHRVVQRLHHQHGKFARIGPNALSINSHSAVGPIYSAAQCLDRSQAYNLHVLPGDGLFFVLGRDAHNPRRSQWASAFTSANLTEFEPILDRRTLQLIECIHARTDNLGAVDLARCLEDWSYDFMGDFMFGASSELELMRNGDKYNLVKNGKTATALFDILGEVPWLLDILWYFPSTQSIRQLHSLARRLVAQGDLASETSEGHDLLSHLRGKDIRGNSCLSKDEKTMDAVFGIQAGSDTTANVLQYTFLFILTHREVYKKLQKELDEAFPFQNTPMDFDNLASLPYLNAVINEGLRLGTPLSGLSRVVPASGMVIDGEFIPGDTIVSVPAFTQQLDPDNFYPEPEKFIPERWMSGGLGPGSKLEPGAVMSFSTGPFGCLGRSLAWKELQVVIARLVLAFDLEPLPDFDASRYHDGIRNIRTTFFPSPLIAKVASRTS